MTAEEFLKQVSPNDEFGIRADLKAAKIEKHVIDIMERYATLRIHDVVGRSEQLKAFADWLQSDMAHLNYDFKDLVDEYLKSL